MLIMLICFLSKSEYIADYDKKVKKSMKLTQPWVGDIEVRGH